MLTNLVRHSPEAMAGVPATAERLLSPAAVESMLENATIEELAAFFVQARELGARAWMAMAVCVGLAQEKAGRGDDVLGNLSRAFGLHRSRIARLGRIYREILRSRIEESGDAATFVLPEQGWYEIAVEAAPQAKRSPEELLQAAEDNKLNDPRYSTRQFREDLGLVPEEDPVAKLRSLLAKLSSIDDGTVAQLIQSADWGELEPMVESSLRVLEKIGVPREA